MQRRAGRGWIAFSLIGIAVWITAMVLAGVLSDDPTDPKQTLYAFVIGGSLFFGLMFSAALWQQLHARAADPESRFARKVAVGYSITGAVVTGLGLAAVAQQGLLGGGDVRIFIYPLVAIVLLWAVAAVLILRRYSRS